MTEPVGSASAEVDAEPDGYTAEISYEVTAQIEHHAPCVPECAVCYPEDKTSEESG